MRKEERSYKIIAPNKVLHLTAFPLRSIGQVSLNDRTEPARFRPIVAGRFAIRLTASADAPPISLMELTAILGFGGRGRPPNPASLAAHPAAGAESPSGLSSAAGR